MSVITSADLAAVAAAAARQRQRAAGQAKADTVEPRTYCRECMEPLTKRVSDGRCDGCRAEAGSDRRPRHKSRGNAPKTASGRQ